MYCVLLQYLELHCLHTLIIRKTALSLVNGYRERVQGGEGQSDISRCAEETGKRRGGVGRWDREY